MNQIIDTMACDAPISIRLNPPRLDENGNQVNWFPADCGKCLMCLGKRKAQWSFRLVEEKRQSFSSYFVTLTYNDKWVPYADGYCANKNDHKDFIKWLKYYERPENLAKREKISIEELKRKRARVSTRGKKLKYYGIIEYGDKKGRPHFHYILFNVRDSNNINMAWADQVCISKGNYQPGESKGKVDIDECNVNTIDYVLKYMVKVPRDGEKDDKQKEMNFQSKGLGLSIADREFIKHIKRPDGNQVVNTRGTRIALPRYYRKKFVTEKESERKIKYIRKEIEKKEVKVDKALRSQGLDPAKVQVNEKETRFNSLKRRRRRDYE